MTHTNHNNINIENRRDFPNLQQSLPAISSNLTTKQQDGTPHPSRNALHFIEKECESLFGSGLFLIIKKIKEFLPEYLKIINITEKQIYLIRFIMSIVDTP